jgi:hypothetical protein
MVKSEMHKPGTLPLSFVAAREISVVVIGVVAAIATAVPEVAGFVHLLAHTMPSAVILFAVRNKSAGSARTWLFDYLVVFINGEDAFIPTAAKAVAVLDKLVFALIPANATYAMHI